jgi:tetratricopeptide (TPR) repeat protein
VELDNTYAEAYAGLAQALIFAGIYEFRTFADAYREAREAATKALEFDGASAGAHNALADIHKGLDWDFAAAERVHRVALALNPSHLLARLWFAETLSRQERHEEALTESARAIDLDPVSPLSHNARAMFLWRASRFEESIEEATAALDLDPSHVNALWWQGLAYSGRGDYELAAETLDKGLQFAKAPVFVSALGYVHGRAGHRDAAHAAISTLHDMEKNRYVSAANFAMVHAGLEEADAAFEWLYRAFEARDGRVHQLVWPCFDHFRSDARYSELKNRIGL